MFYGVTRSVCVYSIAERPSLVYWQTDKVLFLFSNVKTEKLQRGLVNSKIINSISLPKLQEFCNENAATRRPSLLRSRYSYIIKRLVKTLNQPMTATQLEVWEFTKEIERIFATKEATSVSVHMKECFYWSNAVTWCVTWTDTKVVNAKEGTEDFGARKMEQLVCIPMWYV